MGHHLVILHQRQPILNHQVIILNHQAIILNHQAILNRHLLRIIHLRHLTGIRSLLGTHNLSTTQVWATPAKGTLLPNLSMALWVCRVAWVAMGVVCLGAWEVLTR